MLTPRRNKVLLAIPLLPILIQRILPPIFKPPVSLPPPTAPPLVTPVLPPEPLPFVPIPAPVEPPFIPPVPLPFWGEVEAFVEAIRVAPPETPPEPPKIPIPVAALPPRLIYEVPDESPFEWRKRDTVCPEFDRMPEVLKDAISWFFNEDVWCDAAKVTFGESGWRFLAIHDSRGLGPACPRTCHDICTGAPCANGKPLCPRELSVGVWQINMLAHPQWRNPPNAPLAQTCYVGGTEYEEFTGATNVWLATQVAQSLFVGNGCRWGFTWGAAVVLGIHRKQYNCEGY